MQCAILYGDFVEDIENMDAREPSRRSFFPIIRRSPSSRRLRRKTGLPSYRWD